MIFVFGSNLQGIHGAGSALEAVNYWGAIPGQGTGPQGQSFAIPTKWSPNDTMSLGEIKKWVDNFIQYADEKEDTDEFFLTRIGCGLAGYKDRDIAPLFKHSPGNVIMNPVWEDIIWENGIP